MGPCGLVRVAAVRVGRAVLVAWLGVAGAAPAAARQAAFPTDPRIDSIFAPWDRPGSPGCALGVLREGRLVYARGYGFANLDYHVPITPRVVFYSGSVSKQFTAAAIALLAAEGRIALDDDVRRYIPELPDYGRPITIRHLIHHTSGLRDIYVLMDLAGLRLEDVFTDDDALRLIGRQKGLNFAPGDEHLYSNSGYFLLAQLVKRVTGASLRVYAEEKLFRPLGMTRTHFHDEPGHVLEGRAISYQPAGDTAFRISYLTNFDKIGAGGLYTTVEDMAKWDANFYTGMVGGTALLDRLHERGVLTTGDTLAYAFGLTIGELRGLRTVRHSGSMMGFQAHFLRLPEQRFSAVALCNLGNISPGALLDRVAAVYLGDRMHAPPARAAAAFVPAQRARASGEAVAALDPATMRALAGTWYSEEVDALYRVEPSGTGLVLVRGTSGVLPLRPLGDDTFRAGSLTLHFARDGAGVATAFTVEAGRVRDIRFVRVADAPPGTFGRARR